MNADLLPLLDRLGRPRVLVVGDLILDRYTWGDAERVSQEAPVILLRADKREARLGGAANVCHMLRGLEADVRCAGVVGADPDGAAVRHFLHDAGVDASCVLRDAGRPTTVKERFIGRAAGRHPHQILRVDTEVREPLSEELEHRLAAQLIEGLHEFDVVLVSDYDKGVCTPHLLAELVAACRARRIPVVVDPIRGGDYSRYRGATTMTPNRLEAELASGVKIKRPQDAFAAGRKLCAKLGLEYAIITLDCDGMVLSGTARGESATAEHEEHFPTRPRAVYDITGAGDMVLATIGLGVAAGLPIEDTIRLANVAGGLEVEQVGVVPISREEIRLDILRHGREGSASKIVSREDAARIARASREKGQRIVFTNGCFDLLHQGHVAYLEEAAAQGDLLVLGLNSDSSVRGLKGPGRPVRKQADRAAVLAALAHVDYVVIFDEPTPIDLIQAVRPDVLVKGGDNRHRAHEIPGREFVESYGGRLYLAGYVEGASTTNIIRTIAA
jgi:D-beta-D-heptose 7-phosphate kinase/D-beta-D-heptose 1-phosphate adenosyltransferase